MRKETYVIQQSKKVTYYVRDTGGNVMGVYTQDVQQSGSTTPTIAEHTVFGAGRIGMHKRSATPTGNFTLYELTDHLGNVRAVVKKITSSGGAVSAQVINRSDYYPFGMPLPNREITDANYRYKFQGQEKDTETGMEAFELRLWDGRLGRWQSPDPAHQYASPYLGMGNNPIIRIDPDGGEDDWYKNKKTGETKWIDGNAEIAGYEHLGFDFSITDVNNNLVEYGLGTSKLYWSEKTGIKLFGATATSYAKESAENDALLEGWIEGSLPDVMVFNESNSRTNAFINYIGVRMMVNDYKNNNKTVKDRLWKFSPNGNKNNINNFGDKDPYNLRQSTYAHLSAVLNSPARLFTGSFTVTVTPIDAHMIQVTVYNRTSLNSLLLHAGVKDKKSGMFKTVAQKYTWIERY